MESHGFHQRNTLLRRTLILSHQRYVRVVNSSKTLEASAVACKELVASFFHEKVACLKKK